MIFKKNTNNKYKFQKMFLKKIMKLLIMKLQILKVFKNKI